MRQYGLLPARGETRASSAPSLPGDEGDVRTLQQRHHAPRLTAKFFMGSG